MSEPYRTIPRSVPVPAICPACGGVLFLYYSPTTGAPLFLRCVKRDWTAHIDTTTRGRAAERPAPQE